MIDSAIKPNEITESKKDNKGKKKDSVASVIAAILGLFYPLCIIGGIVGIVDLAKGKKDGKRHIGSIFSIGMCVILILVQSGKSDDNSDVISTSEPKSSKEEKEISSEYVNAFDLLDNFENYNGKYVKTSVEIGIIDRDRKNIKTAYIGYKDRMVLNLKEKNDNVEVGNYATVVGYVGENYVLNNAEILEISDNVEAKYEEEETNYYKERTEKEALEQEKREEEERIAAAEEVDNIRENAETPSYDDLMRYPDTYKEKPICLKAKVIRVEPDGLIFDGEIEGEYQGKKIALYDKRFTKEPKLLEGDNITIYGYGGGLTTIKVQDTSGIIPKTVDKYDIPSLDIKDIDFD